MGVVGFTGLACGDSVSRAADVRLRADDRPGADIIRERQGRGSDYDNGGLAGFNTQRIDHHHCVCAAIFRSHIIQGVGGPRSVRNIHSIEPPLIGERQRAVGAHLQRQTRAGRQCLALRLEANDRRRRKVEITELGCGGAGGIVRGRRQSNKQALR